PSLYLPSCSDSPADIDLDALGNLYVALGADGIYKVSPTGVISPSAWSHAPTKDLTLTPDGDAYAAGEDLCNCIMHINADGSYAPLLADGHRWTRVRLAPDGTLYATIQSASVQG